MLPDKIQERSLIYSKGFQFIEMFAGDGHCSKSLKYGCYRVAQLDLNLGDRPGVQRHGKVNPFDLLTPAGMALHGCMFPAFCVS